MPNIAFHVVGNIVICGVRRLSQSRGCLALDITHPLTIEQQMSKHRAFQLLSHVGQILPGSGYQSSSLAFILIRGFSSPYPAAVRNLRRCISVLRQRHATLPREFPLTDKSWDDRLSFSPAFPDILVYRLLKADFGIYSYGRTMVSLPSWAESSFKVVGSLPPRKIEQSQLPIMVSALSLYSAFS